MRTGRTLLHFRKSSGRKAVKKGFKETTELAHRERLFTLLFHSTQKICKMCKWCFCFYFEEKMMGILLLFGWPGSVVPFWVVIWVHLFNHWPNRSDERMQNQDQHPPYRCVCNHVQSDILDDFSETDIHERKNWSCLAYRCVTKADSISQLVHLNAFWKLSILIQHCCEPPTSECYQWPLKLFNSCKR